MSKQYYRKNIASKLEKAPVDIIEKQIEAEPVVETEPIIEVKQARKPLYTVSVTHPFLKKRQAPSFSGLEVGFILDKGNYEIFNEYDNWGQLEDNNWICLDYTVKHE